MKLKHKFVNVIASIDPGDRKAHFNNYDGRVTNTGEPLQINAALLDSRHCFYSRLSIVAVFSSNGFLSRLQQ